MNDIEKTETFVTMLEALEIVDNLILITYDIENVAYSDVDQNVWLAVQKIQANVRDMAETFKMSISTAAKLVDNDALMSHMTVVLDTD